MVGWLTRLILKSKGFTKEKIERDPKRLTVELLSAIHKDCSIRGRRGSMVVKKGMPCRSQECDILR